ncbi:MAG: M20 family metallo-hydrolase [Selenomonas sp.]|nr:M20 family metallo-hydrolase [Selenomonas sp.]
MISEERLSRDFAEMAKCSATQGQAGITRLAFSESDWQGRAYIIKQMEDIGLTVRTDAFGNVIGRMNGSRNDLPPVLFGSHGDSVPGGGNYDGVVGVLAALEVMRSLKEEGFVPEHPLEIVQFMCEESSRFGAATLGSRAMRGKLSQADLQRLKDKQGNTLYAVLQGRGLQPDKVGPASYPAPPKAFFEVHIEQGKVLEHQQIPIGVVTGIAAPTRLRLYLHGNADHSGATPMHLRQDGLCAAAEIVLKLEALAAAQQEPPVVGTVGILQVQPCVMNVIPGECELGIDIRSISAAAKDKVEAGLRQAIAEICQRRSIPYDIEEVSKETPVTMQPAMIEFLTGICRQQGADCIAMPSGAGHDAMHWADFAPVGMLFIPCKDGISHNAAEFAAMKDIVNVTGILAAAVKEASRAAHKF